MAGYVGINDQKLNDDMCRRALNRAHKKVVEEMEPDVVLDGLKKTGFLSQQEYEDLQNLITKPMKNRILVSKISQGGKKVYCYFKKCLSDTNHEQLVKELEEKENELITEIERLRTEGRKRKPHEPSKQPSPPQQRHELPPAPALQGSTFNVLSREKTITIRKDLHDGRLIELNKEMIDELKSPTVSDYREGLRGGYGKVYVSRGEVPAFNLRVALKEINLEETENQSDKKGSVINEKIAARVMHFGIVPQLAYHDDDELGKFYFVSPYFENGDLFQAIKKDTEIYKLFQDSKKDTYNMERSPEVKLNWITRVKIMYQIACAIDFIHDGNKFRGPILHMDIKSMNIVLDAKLNARLIDFGLARELKAGSEDLQTTLLGTPAYQFTVQQFVLTKQHDYHHFGVVLIELITGLQPNATDSQYRLAMPKWDKTIIEKKIQKDVWKTDFVAQDVAKIAIQCTESVKPYSEGKKLKSKDILSKLEAICRKNSGGKWDATDNDRCEICLVNESLAERYDGHAIGRECSRPIRTCCSCVRNSYINKVVCHTCGETIEPFINDKWGAILLAGYDETDGKVFVKDIAKFREVITSMLLPVMCIRPANVIVVPDKSRAKKAIVEEIQHAFVDLSHRDIQTLLFVYSGHNGQNGFQVAQNEYFSEQKLSDQINMWNSTDKQNALKKAIVFLDCCNPKKLYLNESVTLLQLNATGSYSEALANRNTGSEFIQYVIQALTARANGKTCQRQTCKCSSHLNGSFITLTNLCDYISEHITVKWDGDAPTQHTQDSSSKDSIVAYNYDFEVKFEFTIVWPNKPKTKKIPVLPTDGVNFDELKKIVAEAALQHVYGIKDITPDVLSKFAEVVCIEIDTGPRAKHVEEIDNDTKLLLAWSSKRLLRCTPRIVHNIGEHKPVGRCCTSGTYIQKKHQDIIQECNLNGQRLSVSDLTLYKKKLEQTKKREGNEFLADYISDLAILIRETQEKQLKENCLEIAFYDLPNDFTLVYLSLLKKTGVEETSK